MSDILFDSRANAQRLLNELRREQAELRDASLLSSNLGLPKGLAAIERLIEAAEKVSKALE